MLKLETFTELDFDRLIDWFNSKKELTQFAASLFKFPLTRNQLFTYINTTDLYPYKIIHMESEKIIGHCELNFQNEIKDNPELIGKYAQQFAAEFENKK